MVDGALPLGEGELLELHVRPLEGMHQRIDSAKFARFLQDGQNRHYEDFLQHVLAVVGEVEGSDQREESGIEHVHIGGELSLSQLAQVDCCEIFQLLSGPVAVGAEGECC